MEKDDATWLNICYVGFAAVCAFVAYRAIDSVGVQMGFTERYDEWFPAFNNLGAIAFGAAVALWVRSSDMRREYHVATIGELRKVTWPSLPDTKKMTAVVAVVVAIFSVILSAFDLLWSAALKSILP